MRRRIALVDTPIEDSGIPGDSGRDQAAASRRIRVLSVVRHPVGGIRTYLRYTYGGLPAWKYDFTVLAVGGPETACLAGDLASRPVRLIETPDDHASLALLAAAARALRTGAYDLVHSHGYTAGAIAAIANGWFRVPHVVTSHDVFRPDQFTGLTGRLKALLLTRLLTRADVVQSVSRDAQANLLEYLPGITGARLVVIRNGIEVERFRPGRAADDASDRPMGRPFVFGFFGRLMPQKGFEYLVDAVQALHSDPSWRDRFLVRVVSDGGFIREHRASIAARGLERYFEFAGFVPDISAALDALDGVVMPSLWEACGLVAMETLVAGRPLIAARCIGLREVIEETVALPVRAGDATDLASAMRRIMQNPEQPKRDAREFAPTARERFDARHASRALDALFDHTLAAKRQRTVA